jgi:hypothetical protein
VREHLGATTKERRRDAEGPTRSLAGAPTGPEREMVDLDVDASVFATSRISSFHDRRSSAMKRLTASAFSAASSNASQRLSM